MKRHIPLFGIYHNDRMDAAAIEVLRSGQLAGGKYVQDFTSAFQNLVAQRNVVTVNDMSNAILIALRLAGVRPGDEVLTTSYACMSTNAPIANAGAFPAWVDVDPKTGTMDPAALRRSITDRTRAVIVYHLAGYPAKIKEISEICAEHNIALIEDCDNALLAKVEDSQVGTFGDFAIYSFYPNRQINATEGGALACKRPEDAERATRLRRYGIDLPRFRDELGEIDADCDIAEVGFPATLNNICSAVALSQCDNVEERIQSARNVAERYRMAFEGNDLIELVEIAAGDTPSYWAYLIKLQNRDIIMKDLKGAGIHVSKLHHRTDLYSGFGAASGNLPGTEHFLDRVLALPCGWWLNDDDVSFVIETLSNALTMTN